MENPKPAFDAPVGPPGSQLYFTITDENGNARRWEVFGEALYRRGCHRPSAIRSPPTPLVNNILMVVPENYDFVVPGQTDLECWRTIRVGYPGQRDRGRHLPDEPSPSKWL